MAGLIGALAAWVSIGRNRFDLAVLGRDGSQPPGHHRRRDRRHLALRRSRIDPWHAVRRPYRRCRSMGLNMMGADPQWKFGLTGVLIISAVAIDQWIRKVAG